MIENLQEIFEKVTLFDYVYVVLTVLFIIQGCLKGFVLSILSVSKWILAYIITIYIFPHIKPYVKNIIDNEYVLDIILGFCIFIIIIFIILLINRAIKKVVSYSGIGTIDKIFGFFFGIIKAYVIVVCLYSAAEIIYNHEKWPLNLDNSFIYPWVEKGSNYLIKEFPDENEYRDAKEKIQDI